MYDGTYLECRMLPSQAICIQRLPKVQAGFRFFNLLAKACQTAQANTAPIARLVTWGTHLCDIHTTAALPAFTRYRVRIKRSGELVHTRTVTAPATTHTENSLGWGMYTVEVAAVSDNGVTGQDATTSPLTVGAPGKLAAAPSATGGIGNLTLEWEKPADNPDPANTVFFAKVRISGPA